MERRSFGAVDYVVFVGLLALSAGIGVFYAFRGRKESTSDYLMAKSNMRLFPVSLSLMASFMSAITIIGMPAEFILNGTMYFMYIFGIAAACLVTALVFVPFFFPMNFISSFEYIQQRFGSTSARIVSASILSLSQVVYIGAAALAPATALEAVTGFPTWATILITNGVATFYTFLGGIKAVVWTDALQSVIMIGGLFAIIIKGTIEVGPLSTVWTINYNWSRIEFMNVDPDMTTRHTFWGLLIGGCFAWTGMFGINQASIQRYCSLPTLQLSRMSLMLNILLNLILFIVVGLVGLVIFAYYAQRGCDPFSANLVSSSNQIVPFFVLNVVNYPGVPGLFLSSLFSGALSSISSALSALAAIGLQDFVKPLYKKPLTERTTKTISKLIVAGCGALGVIIAFVLSKAGGTVLQVSLTFTASALSPILGVFLLAAAVPFANSTGTIVGVIVGLVVPMWLGIGKYVLQLPKNSLPLPTSTCNLTSFNTTVLNFTTTVEPLKLSGIEPIYTVSYLWYPMIGTLVTILVGCLVSLCTNGLKQQIDPYFMFEFLPYGRRKSSEKKDLAMVSLTAQANMDD